MAKTGKSSQPAAGPPAAEVAEPLTVKQLAEAVLARTIRPRVADVRRLAEAVLKKKNKAKKADRKRKLSKIPARTDAG